MSDPQISKRLAEIADSGRGLEAVALDLAIIECERDSLQSQLDDATAERDRLLNLLVRPWSAGGWIADVPWRKSGYENGSRASDQICGHMGYVFENQDAAFAACLAAAK